MAVIRVARKWGAEKEEEAAAEQDKIWQGLQKSGQRLAPRFTATVGIGASNRCITVMNSWVTRRRCRGVFARKFGEKGSLKGFGGTHVRMISLTRRLKNAAG